MLKRFFGFLNSPSPSHDKGVYFYVRVYRLPAQPSDDDEVVKIRIDPANDVSMNDAGEYFVRKEVVGPKTFRRATLTVYFDAQRRVKDSEVEQGELTDRATYEAAANQA